MNDFRLALVKHARILLPLTGVMLVPSLVRVFSDELLAMQVYGLGVMLVSVGMTVYALDAVIRLVGLADDRLMLLSPRPRWRILLLECAILSVLVIIGHLVALLPSVFGEDPDWQRLGVGCASYIVSVFAGLGLMALLVYIAKPLFRGHSALRGAAWFAFAVVTVLGAWGCVSLLEVLTTGDVDWILGVADAAATFDVYIGVLPITVQEDTDVLLRCALFGGLNFALGFLAWLSAWLLSKCARDYIER